MGCGEIRLPPFPLVYHRPKLTVALFTAMIGGGTSTPAVSNLYPSMDMGKCRPSKGQEDFTPDPTRPSHLLSIPGTGKCHPHDHRATSSLENWAQPILLSPNWKNIHWLQRLLESRMKTKAIKVLFPSDAPCGSRINRPI